MIELKAPAAALLPLSAQVRGLLDRLRQGALSADDLTRALALNQAAELERSLDPRRRIVDLFRDARDANEGTQRAQLPIRPSPSLDAWRTWASATLRDDRLVVVFTRAKR